MSQEAFYATVFSFLGVVVVAMSLTQATQSEGANDATIYVVTYVDVMPPSKDDGIALLRQYREASRQDAGKMCIEVLQQYGRPHHFVILETWQDQPSFEAHTQTAHVAQFREKLQAFRNSPNDERVHTGFSIGTVQGAPGGAAVYVVTHVDIIPPRKDDGAVLLKQLGDDSRADEGNVRYEIWQQTSRPNHFTVVEIWRNPQAFEAHTMTTHTRQFREQLQPMSGSLYDERLYQMLD
jgi:quinol monooxygenase YgiN